MRDIDSITIKSDGMNTLMKRKNVFPDFRWIDDFWDDSGRFFKSQMPEFNTPAVNVIETPTEFTMEFGVPGMERSDFDLKVENGLLKLSAEKTTEQNDVDGDFKRREFNYQSFERSFWLPETILTEEIKASYENGILKVVLPKKVEAEKAIQNKIEVN